MEKQIRRAALWAFACLGSLPAAQAQSKLYPRLFDLQEVTLEAGVFKQAMERNDSLLLEYDVDRLLTPYFRQAGISAWEQAHPNFTNWGSGNFRLDGHVGGHYLSALALAYASTRDEQVRQRMKERMDYVVDRMAECQAVFDTNTDGLRGYIGGLPDNTVWTRLAKGDFAGYNANRGNVPLYTLHKIYAGLRDAWMYGGNEKARTCFLKLCDWGAELIDGLTDEQVQSLLDTEHGGINEMYADAYQMTGDERYLKAAKRYSHRVMVTNMQAANPTFLDNKHANTQVPKYIGFLRIAQQEGADGTAAGSADADTYRRAAETFWHEVVDHRTLALGGNSIGEHFLPANRCSEYISHPDGPESCNTNNMMKLTEDLFADRQDARYADFYEQAMLNHILSTQNPRTGGYVYFTSLRPQHYRMYSQVNQGMWCCVGTGMENHSKYGEFIYAHSPANDTLYVNLFTASTLDSPAFAVEQQTAFPYEEGTLITVRRDGEYTLAVRRPSWCRDGFGLTVNGTEADAGSLADGYACLRRTWKSGDRIAVRLPMKLEIVPCPNYTDYVAFRYGPVLLGAITGTENLVGQFAGEGRMDHAPSQGSQLSLTSAPMLIGNRADVADSVYAVDKARLHFKIRKGLYNNAAFADLVLQPFFTIHEARYMMYWNQLTREQWEAIRDEVEAEEQQAQRLNARTLDFVATGEQQSDAGHVLQGDFGKGAYDGEFYVDAQSGRWFSYQLATQGTRRGVSLQCRYHSADAGRVYTLYVNDRPLREIRLEARNVKGFYNVEYPLPEDMLLDAEGEVADSITVRFAATGSTPTPGIYYLRLLKDYRPAQPYRFVCRQWLSGDPARVNGVEYDDAANTVKVYGKPGNNNIALQYSKALNDSAYVAAGQNYLLVRGRALKTGGGTAYLWWLNGCNKGTQVAPAYTLEEGDETCFVWDIKASGLGDNLQGDSISVLSTHGAAVNTVFGLTSSADDHSAVLTDISFYSLTEMLVRYPALKDALKTNVLDENSDAQEVNRLYRNTVILKSFSDRGWTPACLPLTLASTRAKECFSEIKKYAGLTADGEGAVTLFFTDDQRIEKGELYLVKTFRPTDGLELLSTRADTETAPRSYTSAGVTVRGTYVREAAGRDAYLYGPEGFAANEEGAAAKGLGFYVQPAGGTSPAVTRVSVSFDPLPTGIRAARDTQTDAPAYTPDGLPVKPGQPLPQKIEISEGKKRVAR